MRPVRFILLVEDDDDQIGSWQAEFKEFNKNETNPFVVELITARTYEEASVLLERCQLGAGLDAGIVDLRIPTSKGGGQGAENGNQAVEDLLDAMPGPIAIFSAHPGEIDDRIKDVPVKVFVKEEGQQQAIIAWICDHAPLMAAIRDTIADIRAEAAGVFASTIWPRWADTKKRKLDATVLQQLVTRQVVAHLTEQLSLSSNDAPPYHAAECYFDPPLRKSRLHTGDLLNLEDGVHVILTPQCDIVRQYPDQILLGKCSVIENWYAVKDKQNYATQNKGLKKHFLPPCNDRGPWMVDFNSLKTVPGSEGDQLLPNRFASIAPQFIPNLVQRFSAFIGRIGSPDIDVPSLDVAVDRSG
jgi:hypothetical protein